MRLASNFGRKITVVIGHGGVLAAVVFLLAVLILKEWIPPSAAPYFFGAISEAYRVYGLGFAAMVSGLIGLVIMHERLWLFIVGEKNKEIQRVVDQRNRLEDIILGNRGSTGGAPPVPE